MAKTLKLLKNNLRIKYLVKPRKFYLFYGSIQIRINGNYSKGFDTLEAAEKVGNSLELEFPQFKDLWTTVLST